MYKLSLVLLAFLVRFSLYGQVEIPEDDAVEITSAIGYFIDSTGSLSLDDISHMDSSFQPAPADGLRLNDLDGSLWLRLKLVNSSDQTEESILMFDDPSLYKIILYEQGESPSLGGTSIEQEHRDLPGNHNAFNITMSAVSTEILYIRIESPNFITATATIYDPGFYYEQTSQEYSLLGVFYGILMLVTVYSIFLYALTRMRVFLIYASYILVSMLFTGMMDGFTPMFLPWLVDLFRGYLEFVLAGVANALAVLFTARFLGTKYWSKRLHNVLKGVGYTLLGSTTLILFINPDFGFEFMRVLGLPILILILTAGALAFRKNIEQAAFFLWAFMTYGVFILVFMLSLFRIIPFGFLATYILHFGIILNLLILSFALAFRIFRRYKASYDEIELSNELYSLKNIELEQLVWERTKEVIYKENELRSIIDNSNSHIWLVDSNYALRDTNKSFAEAWKFSYGRELEKGKNILEQVTIPEHATLWKTRYDYVFTGKNTSFTDRYPIEGKERIFEINAFPIREDDKVVAAAIFSRDITERIRYQDQLEEKNLELQKANEELDSFVYSASHDLKAPLASIQGLIGLARNEKEVKQLKTYFDMMERSVRRMDQFIRDIIDYSRNSRIENKTEIIDDCGLLKSILEDLKFMNPSDKTEIILKKEEGSAILKGDEIRLRIILRNLISNALSYGKPEKGKPVVEIRWKITNDQAVFEVSDNGPGIDKEHLPRIFDMFYRANETATGSGLGLYIVKESMNKLGGEIEVTSSPHEGSTFTVILPNYSDT